MARFRSKPKVVEAWCNDGSVPPDWIQGRGSGQSGHAIVIMTLEGAMTAAPGDWIIKGVKGEIYPCKPDIFAMTYEPFGD